MLKRSRRLKRRGTRGGRCRGFGAELSDEPAEAVEEGLERSQSTRTKTVVVSRLERRQTAAIRLASVSVVLCFGSVPGYSPHPMASTERRQTAATTCVCKQTQLSSVYSRPTAAGA
eukprot:3077165-Rhodomonas_salina.3